MFELMNNNYMDDFNPFRAMKDLERNFFGSQNLGEFKTDITDEGDHYLLQADLPGFDKKDIKLSLQGDVLSIRAERHSELEQKDQQGKVVCRERSYGTYGRQFDVSNVDTEKISAKYENGVLKLVMPKKQEALTKSRTLQIE